jgi:hypothetical protein
MRINIEELLLLKLLSFVDHLNNQDEQSLIYRPDNALFLQGPEDDVRASQTHAIDGIRVHK